MRIVVDRLGVVDAAGSEVRIGAGGVTGVVDLGFGRSGGSERNLFKNSSCIR